MVLRTISRVAFRLLAALLTLGITTWSCLSLWYRAPGTDLTRGLLALGFAFAGVLACYGVLRGRRRAVTILICFFALDLVWWSTIRPPAEADWADDVSRQVTGIVDGDRLLLRDIRDFDWRSDTDYTQRWDNREYDLKDVRTLDLFMSYWAGPEMAHMVFSFGFADGRYLAWSVEVRRRKGGEFSPIGDLFKSNPLVIVASEERDVIRVRSNVRNENVQLYRLNTSPDIVRDILLAYVSQSNDLASNPRFYNSLMSNCTTSIFALIKSLGISIPLDWRLIVNGYLPDYAYEIGVLDRRKPLAEIRNLAQISARARNASPEEFSSAIRVGVPVPAR